MPDITVLVELNSQQFQSGTGSWGATYNADLSNIQTKNLGNGQPFDIIQPSVCTNFIIKAKKEKIVQKDLTLSEILQEIKKTQNINTYTSPAQFRIRQLYESSTNLRSNAK